MRKNLIRKMTALLLAMVMCSCLQTALMVNAQETDEQWEQTDTRKDISVWEDKSTEKTECMMSARASASELHAPRIKANSGMDAKQKVIWDCVWFGSYPQSEVTDSDPIYSTLQNANGWDARNDLMLDGNRYRRMKKGDATYSDSSGSYYNWPDADTYHYFKYEPVKWRVLKIEDNQALLLSDAALDAQQYHTAEADTTWEASTIRSWLNGYDSSYNQQKTDYSSRNFIDCAFTPDEQSAIAVTSLVNADNLSHGTPGGNHTTDKIFLLSESEVYGESAAPYGFVSDRNKYDEARRSKSSTYAKAMGVYSSTGEIFKDNCHWCLRSPGESPKKAVEVNTYGIVNSNWCFVYFRNVGVRAAMNLNLSSDQWTYAGTVDSNGVADEETGRKILVESVTIEEKKLTLKPGDNLALRVDIMPEDATLPEVTWSSSDKSVASVDETGMLTAAGAGKCIIQCTAADGSGKYDTAEVEVLADHTSEDDQDKVQEECIKVSKITVSGISKKIAAGKKIKLTAKIFPSNASNKSVTWKSLNRKIASVDSKGIVRIKSGTGGKKVTVTAAAKDGSKVKASYKIRVMRGVVKKITISGKKSVKAGKSRKLTARVKASKGANKKLVWKSSNTRYATVTGTGKVKTKKAGKGKKVYITAMATDGSGKKKTAAIKIR